MSTTRALARCVGGLFARRNCPAAFGIFVFEVAFFGTEDPGQVKARCQLGIPDVAEMDLSDDDRDDIALRVAKDIARAADDG